MKPRDFSFMYEAQEFFHLCIIPRIYTLLEVLTNVLKLQASQINANPYRQWS